MFFFNFNDRVIVIGPVKITGAVPGFGPGQPSIGFGLGPRSFVTAVIHVGALFFGCWSLVRCFLFLVASCVVFFFIFFLLPFSVLFRVTLVSFLAGHRRFRLC